MARMMKKRLTLRQRALAGKDIKVYVRSGFDFRIIRSIYLEHVPFHYKVKKRKP
jgi:hypothetical protein